MKAILALAVLAVAVLSVIAFPSFAAEGPMQRMYRLFREFAPEDSNSQIEKLNALVRGEIDATPGRIAFSTALPGSRQTVGIAVYTFDTGSLVVLRPPTEGVGYFDPHFSAADPDLLYVRQQSLDTPKITTLKRCNVQSRVCEEVLTLEGAIENPIETPEGLLFVHSPVDDDKFEQFGFGEHDFYLIEEDGKIDRLTNLEYFRLNSVSLLPDRLVFEAGGLSRKAQARLGVEEQGFRIGESNSSIRTLRYEGSLNNLRAGASIVEPYAAVDASVSTGPSISPSMRAGSPLLAFRNGRGEKGRGYRYNLVVHNIETGKQDYLVADSFNMSAPIIVDGDRVIYFEYIDDSYSIRSYSFSEKKVEEFARLSGEDIWSAEK